MDEITTIQTLKDRVRAFCEARDWDRFHTPKELAIGLVTEASELLQEFRFRSDAEAAAMVRDPAKRTKLAHEAADALYFLLRFCQVTDIDVTTALDAKLRINETRYPVERAKGKNLRSDELHPT